MCFLPLYNDPKFKTDKEQAHGRIGSCLPFQQMHPWEQFKYHISALFYTQSGVESNCWVCIKGRGYSGRIILLILQLSQAEVLYIHEPRKNYCLLSTPNDLTLWDIIERHFFQQLSDTAFWQAVLAECECIISIASEHVGF